MNIDHDITPARAADITPASGVSADGASVDGVSVDAASGRPGLSATFADRHIGPDAEGMATLLHLLDQSDLDALETAAVPAGILGGEPLRLPAPASEIETLAELRALAARNRPMAQMIGLGYHDTITPGVIKRNVLENPAWYTAYTPYQPEISQGRLEALLNFQTAVSDLTGLDIANASMLDEATAAAEAMTLIKRTAKSEVAAIRRRRRHPAADHRRHPDPGRTDRHRGGRRRPVGRGAGPAGR